MKPKARITKVKEGMCAGGYFVEVLTANYYQGLVTKTAQQAFDFCEANNLQPVEVEING